MPRVIWLALVPIACREPVDTDPPDAEGACLEVSPSPLDLGRYVLGAPPASDVLTLSNPCSHTYVPLLRVAVTDAASPFRVVEVSDGWVAPGGSTTARITFDPLRVGFIDLGDVEAAVRVETGGDGATTIDTRVRARIAAARLEVDPLSSDLVDVLIGCSASATFTARNVGDEPLTVEEVDFETGALDELRAGPVRRGDDPIALPAVLEPGEAVTLSVDYAPLDHWVDTASIAVRSSDPVAPGVRLDIRGNGAGDITVDTLLSTGEPSFTLSSTPVRRTLGVVVDGVEATDGWRYDAGAGAVVFDEARVPAHGSEVRVEYVAQPACP